MVRRLRAEGFTNLILISKDEVDLRDPVAVKWMFSVYVPDYVFLCAAKVGGIVANMENPLGFFLDNMAIETNVLVNAADYNVKKLVFLGSSCIYPKECPQPISEYSLLSAKLEPSNEAYALAKIAGIKLCQWLRQQRGCNFVSAMPCNLFGPEDNFDGKTAHIIPGLLTRMHKAKISGAPVFDVWGHHEVRREFLYSDDLAKALMVVMDKYNDPEPINTGSGDEVSVGELARIIAGVTGYPGELQFNQSMPAGVARKLLDNTKLFNLGWKPENILSLAIAKTYDWMLANPGMRRNHA